MAHYDAHATRPAPAGLMDYLIGSLKRLRFAQFMPSRGSSEATCKTALDAETSRDAGICPQYRDYSSFRDVGHGRDLQRTAERIRAGLPG
ncbi:hypothetical protein GR183_10625 [Stappia sp. GBMRC 2046]|uniref:Uncharacterized protein n=1 Tax=Stappia sediminis TaxID=2692190 RepID=A0A7X3S836_9HYPH|nr:hypothetical protein [Stappia sediminis]MXN65355.1 hypothetical protein [Stappia sediminis]